MSREALLSDLDGVLVDSLAVVNRVWTRWANEHRLDPEPFLGAHGRTTLDTLRELAPHLLTLDEVARIENAEASDTQGVTALPGAATLLGSACQVAIVTSATRQLALARLAAARLPVPAVLVTAESVSRGKPDPEPYLLAARKLGAAAADCVVFEDAPAGVQAARRAGMRVVGLTTTVSAEELAEADLVVADLATYFCAPALPAPTDD